MQVLYLLRGLLFWEIWLLASHYHKITTSGFTFSCYFHCTQPPQPNIWTKTQKRLVAIAQKLDLIEQNQCHFWIQRIRFVLSQLTKRRQQNCCWPVLSSSRGRNTSISASPIAIGPAIRKFFVKMPKKNDCANCNQHVPSATDRFSTGTIIFPRSKHID